MLHETVVCPDSVMPSGHDWVKIEFSDGHVATYYSESFAAKVGRRVLCDDGVPLTAAPEGGRRQTTPRWLHSVAS